MTTSGDRPGGPGHPASAPDPERAATPAARRISRRWPLISALLAVALAVGLGALIVVRGQGRPLELDTEWMDEIIEHRNPVWEVPSLVMNFLGAGIAGVIVIPAIILIALLLWRRPWEAGYFVVATILSAGGVQLLKQLFGRARPEDMLVTSDFGSFPSGHVANAATMAVCLGIIVPRLWVWLAGAAYTIVMLLSRTYLGAHWLTDTFGGLLIGVGVAVLLWAPVAAKLDGERRLAPRHPFARTIRRN
ncbi:phosphatase PAP2 family protein [Cryobacterium melibiosiphilum]|uniref:Phosphatase PAP2 family protein n=1 Tax=Cryobacterium melibiosiphilum TaxID=995039 RepID=A0A3A5MEK9_9MICO|nr:phosphatase PAP2 family protein [Cryobacterium melibiosiphilum]RJT85282.1 phosphatase PAP2 family protein [Cryobacterium melibiosiphilum]